jgi:thioredoxin reductase
VTNDDAYEVVVVGGGPAGLTGALVLARARRRVLVIDDGRPRNAASSGIHGFLTRDGMPPTEFLAAARAEVEGYGARFIAGKALAASGEPDAFTVTLQDAPPVTACRLLVTTGLTDILPDVPGLTDRWARDVIHCTACHGWEHRDKKIAVLATSVTAADHALTWRQWSGDVTLLNHTAQSLDSALETVLTANDVTTVAGLVRALVIVDDRLAGVELADGTRVSCQALAVQPIGVARSSLLESLGLPLAPNAHGNRIATGRHGLTAVAGVWAAGNVADPGAQVVTAAAAGYSAAAAINNDLINDDVTERVASALTTNVRGVG